MLNKLPPMAAPDLDLEAPPAAPPPRGNDDDARRRSSIAASSSSLVKMLDPASNETNRNVAVKERMDKPLEEWAEEDKTAVAEELYDSVQQVKADKVKLLDQINEILLGKYGIALKEFIMANPLVIPMLFATLEFGERQKPRKRKRQGKKTQKLTRWRRGKTKA